MNELYKKVSVTKIGGGINLPNLISQQQQQQAPTDTKTIFIDTGREGYMDSGADLTPMDGGADMTPIDLMPMDGGADMTPIDLTPMDGGVDIDLMPMDDGADLTPVDLMPIDGGADLTPVDLMPMDGGADLTPIDLMPMDGGADLTPVDLMSMDGGADIDLMAMDGGADLTPVDLTPVDVSMIDGGADLTPIPMNGEAPTPIDGEANLTPIDVSMMAGGATDLTPSVIFDSYEMEMTGGGKKDNYKEFEYTDNIVADYHKYLEKYEEFRGGEKGKSKYTYSIKDGHMIKTNSAGKELMNIKQPIYININRINRLLTKDIDDLLFKLKQQRDEILLTKNLTKLDAFNKIRKEYIELIDFKNKVNDYSDSVNRIKENDVALRELVNFKMESKRKLQEIMAEIKNKNHNKYSVDDACLEYIEVNNINNLDEQIRKIKETPGIDNIISYNDITEEIATEPEIGSESYDLGVETLNIGDDLEQIKPEEDPEEISFYENKPEVAPEDMDIPLSPVTKDKKKKSLKKKLLKPAKKLAKLSAAAGLNKLPANTNVKESQISATNKSKDGKTRRKIGGVPVKEGKCVFPFKNGKKYITENDGCVKGKTGNWCATEVDKADDYKMKAFGYCN
jgi:hypothetical protein